MKNILKTTFSKEFIRKWGPSWVVMTAIFMGSSIPGQVIQDYGLGKESYHVGTHFWLFFILCFCYFKASKSLMVSLYFTVVYAFLDEFHQYFVPLRSVSAKDIYVDSIAGLVAVLILWKLHPLLPSKLKNWLYN